MKKGEIWKAKDDGEKVCIDDVWIDDSVGPPIDYVEYHTVGEDLRINVLEQRDFIIDYIKVYE